MRDIGHADVSALANEAARLFDPRDPIQSVVVYIPMPASDELGNAKHLFETDEHDNPAYLRLTAGDRRIVLGAYSPVVWIENHRFQPHQLRFYFVGADQHRDDGTRRRAGIFHEFAERCCAAGCPAEDVPAGPSEPPSYPAYDPYRVQRWIYWLHVHAWRRAIGSLVAPRRTALLATNQILGPTWFSVEANISSGEPQPTKAGELDLERGWFSHLTTDVFGASRLVLERVIDQCASDSGSGGGASRRPRRTPAPAPDGTTHAVNIGNWAEGGKAFAEALKTVNGGGNTGAEAPEPKPEASADDEDDEQQVPALTKSERMTLATLATIDASRLMSAQAVSDAMPPGENLSDKTARLAIKKLVKLDLAERPEGKNQGARLTIKGRRLAAKLAD